MYLEQIYRVPLHLLTDLYQLTMAYGYWKLGIHDRKAIFHLFYRKNPFGGDYAITCGQNFGIDFMSQCTGFYPYESLQYLSRLVGNDNKPLFDPEFIQYLGTLNFVADIDAVPEGTMVFPNEPIYRVEAPIIIGQLLETPLLNLTNFPTLIATKAARVVQAAQGDPVLEFGLRRAQGIDGALMASYAAYVGGVDATSNVLAGQLFDIPIRGTHAHSWVMSFEDEYKAFEGYSAAMPNNCVFLVDTYDTMEGINNAIEAGRQLRERGYEMVGIRLDSGDLYALSLAARCMLDAAGFPDTKIVASNDLDEHKIEALKTAGAAVDVWGVGTALVTGADQPALGGVYKLSAIEDESGKWIYKVKLSNDTIKISNPGRLQVDRETGVGDTIFHEKRGRIPFDDENLLLQPVYRGGGIVYGLDRRLPSIRTRVRRELADFDKFEGRGKAEYPVVLDEELATLKERLIRETTESRRSRTKPDPT